MSDIDLSEFRGLEALITKEIANLSKAELSEIAHVLALQVGNYKHKYGELPQGEHEAMLAVDAITEETKQVLVGGLKELLEVIYVIKSDFVAVEEPSESLH